MHNCADAHTGHTHRRRNRALRRERAPLRWFDDPRAASGEWGRGTRRRVVTARPSATAVVARSGEAPEPATDRRVKIFQQSALRRLAAGIGRFNPFARKSPA